MRIPVFTYYAPVPALYTEASQRALISVWARSWERAGWQPVVLEEKIFKRTPRYAGLKKKFLAHPTEYGDEYTLSCYMRWDAVAQYGGGMLVDYDVINYGFEPRRPTDERMILFCDEPPAGVFMGAVLGTRRRFEQMVDIFSNWKIKPEDSGARANWWYYNDMMMLDLLFTAPHHNKPAWLVKENGCALFDYEPWKTSRLVHYGYQMHATGHWPKHEHIERLRHF